MSRILGRSLGAVLALSLAACATPVAYTPPLKTYPVFYKQAVADDAEGLAAAKSFGTPVLVVAGNAFTLAKACVPKRMLGAAQDGRDFGSNQDGRDFGSNQDGRDFGSKQDERDFGSNQDGRDFGSKQDDRDFGAAQEERKFGSGADERDFGAAEDERKFGSNQDGRDFGSGQDQRKFGAGETAMRCAPYPDGTTIYVTGAPAGSTPYLLDPADGLRVQAFHHGG